MPKRPSARSTKTEILDEFDKLFEENKKLIAQLEQLQKEKETLEKKIPSVQVPPKPAKEEAKKVEKEKRLTISIPETMDNIIENLKSMRSGFGKAINELSAILVTEASMLAEQRDKIKEETEDLKILYDLEITTETLNNLIQEYIEKSKLFENEAQQRQMAFEQQMAEKKKAWQKEQEEHARLIKEHNATTEISFQRDDAEYKYNLELQRKLDDEDFQLKLRNLQKELEKIETEMKKEDAEREKAVAEHEEEFDDLKERVENFPKELETAIKNAKAEGREIALREIKKKADLQVKEVEGEKRVYELKIKSLEDIVKNQIQQIQNLSTKLDATLKQAQALAMKAIEGASHISSFESVKEIALEQAKNVQKTK